ncbi:MAG: hypothetical protein LBQ88_02405 [Treponema sp.]|nr:hypothetical protein [Treponema sp.]
MISFIVNLPKVKSKISLKSVVQDKKRTLLIGMAAAALILVICLIALLLRPNREASLSNRVADTKRPPLIPSEELFLPEEPDFLPEILLDREQRRAWTGDDAGIHWKDPLNLGEELWRDEVKSVIDKFLEGIP